jgi:hypothetical protein
VAKVETETDSGRCVKVGRIVEGTVRNQLEPIGFVCSDATHQADIAVFFPFAFRYNDDEDGWRPRTEGHQQYSKLCLYCRL